MNNRFVAWIFLLLVLIGILAWFITGSSRNPIGNTDRQKSKLRISVSIYPLYYFTSRIAGSTADITLITPSGTEPHEYDPSARDVAEIENSDVLVMNGVVGPWADKIIQNLKGKKTMIVTAGEGLMNLEAEEDGKKQVDPHIWLDPVKAKQQAGAILQGLRKADPGNEALYVRNENALATELDALDTEYESALSRCERKDIITSHTAFGYLAARYGLRQVPINGISPEAEPSAQELAELSEFAKANGIRYIFFEELVSPKLAETLASEIGAKTLVLDPIEGVSEDDYMKVMRKNLRQLQTALECKP